MIKLLVVSILDMTDQQLRDYAEAVPNRVQDITAEKFLQDLQKANKSMSNTLTDQLPPIKS